MPASSQPAVAAAPSDTRERILDAAEQLFAERGLAGASVREIAARAGLTPASLYHHFAGKQALYEAVLERGIGPLGDLLSELAARDRTPDAIEASLEAVMAHLGRHPSLPRLVYHEATTGGETLRRLVSQWLRPLVRAGAAEVARRDGAVFAPEERELAILAWLELIFGPFALAPLFREVLGEDPTQPRGLVRQTRFLRKLARLMMGEGGAGGASTSPRSDG